MTPIAEKLSESLMHTKTANSLTNSNKGNIYLSGMLRIYMLAAPVRSVYGLTFYPEIYYDLKREVRRSVNNMLKEHKVPTPSFFGFV